MKKFIRLITGQKLFGEIASAFTCWSIGKRTFYLSPTGNDADDGVRYITAKRTIANVERWNLQGGDRVYLGTGIYREPFEIKTSGKDVPQSIT